MANVTDIRNLSENEKIDWLRLIRSENVGPITFYRLLERFGTATEALKFLPDIAKKAGKKQIKICPIKDAEAELKQAEKSGAKLVAYCEHAYSETLRNIEDAPPILYVIGDTSLLNKPSIGIVGARNASANGCTIARKIAYDLVENGIIVTSGMARGIDTAAHDGALHSKNSNAGTIAVLGTGVETPYPKENAKLHASIAQRGLVVSEFAPLTLPQPSNFPRRNRIISGLSQGILVVEASTKSGSLITARVALEQNREVFAIPGSPTESRSAGPNHLIRDGAHLVENVNDIINIIEFSQPYIAEKTLREETITNITKPPQPIVKECEIDDAHTIILDKMGKSAVSVDELVRLCNIESNIVSAALLELEIVGKIERLVGNKVALASN